MKYRSRLFNFNRSTPLPKQISYSIARQFVMLFLSPAGNDLIPWLKNALVFYFECMLFLILSLKCAVQNARVFFQPLCAG